MVDVPSDSDGDSGPEADARWFVKNNPPCPADKVYVTCSFPDKGRSADACLPRSDVIACTTEAEWMRLLSSVSEGSDVAMLRAWAGLHAAGHARARLGSGPAGCRDTRYFTARARADWHGADVSCMPPTIQPWIVFSQRR
jgi:hypothetical protein